MVVRLIDELLGRLIPNSNQHLSDKVLAELFCRELPVTGSWVARRHLAACADCRARQQSLEGPRAERMLQLYRESMDSAEMILPEKPRAAFAVWLELQMRYEALQSRNIKNSLRPRLLPAIPSVSIGIALGLFTGVTVVSFLWWQHMPGITANTLLVRAEESDMPGSGATPGVAHQTIQIKTSKNAIKRAVNWDLQGIRRPKHPALSATEEQLRSKLDTAGVDWDEPISASSFQAWHDHQHMRADRIVRSGLHLLTLTTTVHDGAVAEESLTVRDTDFHAIERRVGFRNDETVEIAELDFKVLPWNNADTNDFEPAGSLSSNPLHVLPPVFPLPHIQETPTPEQVDETELAARLILNQLQADTGEQIEVHRLPQGVEVVGLVETEERRRELTTELMTVPHLKVSIQSAAHLRETPSTGSVRVEAAALPDQPSALDGYLRTQGRSVKDINGLASQIFNGALTVSQESDALIDLKTHFASTKQTRVLASATLDELLYSHRERLREALRQERILLAEILDTPVSGETDAATVESSLADEAARNLALAKELTQTNVPASRNAEAIIADMSAAVERITAGLESNGSFEADSARITKR
jgi:hypothetical protein